MRVQKRGDRVPKIVIRSDGRIGAALSEGDPASALEAVLTLIAGSGTQARTGLRRLLRSLIDEGCRFAATTDGRRWARILQESPAVTNGWLLWSQSNADFYVRNAEPLADSPAMLFEAALRELASRDLAELLRDLSRTAAALDADFAVHGAPS